MDSLIPQGVFNVALPTIHTDEDGDLTISPIRLSSNSETLAGRTQDGSNPVDPPPSSSFLHSLHQTQTTLPHKAHSPSLARHSFNPTSSPPTLRQSGNTIILEPRLDSPRRLPPSKPTSTHLLPPINTSTALSPQSTFRSPLSPRTTVQSKSSVDGMTQRGRKRLRNEIDENSSASENEEGRKRRKNQKSRGNVTGEELQRSVGTSSAVESNLAPRSALEIIGGRMKSRREKEKLDVYAEANGSEREQSKEIESDLEEGEIREVSNKQPVNPLPTSYAVPTSYVDASYLESLRKYQASHQSINVTAPTLPPPASLSLPTQPVNPLMRLGLKQNLNRTQSAHEARVEDPEPRCTSSPSIEPLPAPYTVPRREQSRIISDSRQLAKSQVANTFSGIYPAKSSQSLGLSKNLDSLDLYEEVGGKEQRIGHERDQRVSSDGRKSEESSRSSTLEPRTISSSQNSKLNLSTDDLSLPTPCEAPPSTSSLSTLSISSLTKVKIHRPKSSSRSPATLPNPSNYRASLLPQSDIQPTADHAYTHESPRNDTHESTRNDSAVGPLNRRKDEEIILDEPAKESLSPPVSRPEAPAKEGDDVLFSAAVVLEQEEKQERPESKAVVNDEPESSELSDLSELEDSEDNEESEENQARRGTDIDSDEFAGIDSDDDGDSSTTDNSSLKIKRNNRAAALDLAVSRAFATPYTLTWTSSTASSELQTFIANRDEILATQRSLHDSEREAQALSIITTSRTSSLESTISGYLTRFADYLVFCRSINMSPFPITVDITALYLFQHRSRHPHQTREPVWRAIRCFARWTYSIYNPDDEDEIYEIESWRAKRSITTELLAAVPVKYIRGRKSHADDAPQTSEVDEGIAEIAQTEEFLAMRTHGEYVDSLQRVFVEKVDETSLRPSRQPSTSQSPSTSTVVPASTSSQSQIPVEHQPSIPTHSASVLPRAPPVPKLQIASSSATPTPHLSSSATQTDFYSTPQVPRALLLLDDSLDLATAPSPQLVAFLSSLDLSLRPLAPFLHATGFTTFDSLTELAVLSPRIRQRIWKEIKLRGGNAVDSNLFATLEEKLAAAERAGWT